MPEATSIHRYRRFRHWDYGRGASLFITIATSPRRACFGRVIGGKVKLNDLGQGVWAALEAMPQLNPGISVFGHVVMPDHVHFNVHIAAGVPEPLKVLGNAIRRFKNHTTKLARLAELRPVSRRAIRYSVALSARAKRPCARCSAPIPRPPSFAFARPAFPMRVSSRRAVLWPASPPIAFWRSARESTRLPLAERPAWSTTRKS